MVRDLHREEERRADIISKIERLRDRDIVTYFENNFDIKLARLMRELDIEVIFEVSNDFTITKALGVGDDVGAAFL